MTRAGAIGAALALGMLGAVLTGADPRPVSAQGGNIMAPVDTIEHRLGVAHFEIIDRRGARFEGDRTSRVALTLADGDLMAVKWAPAPAGGERFNNVPRYELAAYEIQKLFLDEGDRVVPPTVLRALPLSWYRQLDPRAAATFEGTSSVLVVLQYWLYNVSPDDYWDPTRFDADTAYARHFANFNVLTYLIRHSDDNHGNFLVSTVSENPRVFAVDNGISFSSRESAQGHHWRQLRVRRLPAGTVARLRELTPDQLTRRLGTLAEFAVLPDGRLQPVEAGPALDPDRGVRHEGDRVQLGLTRREIDNLWGRIHRLLDRVDRGRIDTFPSPPEAAPE